MCRRTCSFVPCFARSAACFCPDRPVPVKTFLSVIFTFFVFFLLYCHVFVYIYIVNGEGRRCRVECHWGRYFFPTVFCLCHFLLELVFPIRHLPPSYIYRSREKCRDRLLLSLHRTFFTLPSRVESGEHNKFLC